MLVKNIKFQKAIFEVFFDDEMFKIFTSTIDSTKSPYELMKTYNIPHTTLYRKINWMLDSKLLVVERIENNDDGKKFNLLRSTIESVKINYENSKLTVDVKKNKISFEFAAEEFFSL